MRSNHTFYPCTSNVGDAEPKFHVLWRPEYKVETYTFAEFDEKLKYYHTPTDLYLQAVANAKAVLAFDARKNHVEVLMPVTEFLEHGRAIMDAFVAMGFPYVTFDRFTHEATGQLSVTLTSAEAGPTTHTVKWLPREE